MGKHRLSFWEALKKMLFDIKILRFAQLLFWTGLVIMIAQSGRLITNDPLDHITLYVWILCIIFSLKEFMKYLDSLY